MIKRKSVFLTLFLMFLMTAVTYAQDQMNRSQQFRLAAKIVRVAEPGQLADSVNVWGDISSPGRYLIPRGTTLPELISYAGGMSTLNNGQTQLDWSKMRVEIRIHEISTGIQTEQIDKFIYRFEDPFPENMWGYQLKAGQTVTVRVKRKPSFRDYLGVFASTISAVASTIILLDRLNSL